MLTGKKNDAEGYMNKNITAGIAFCIIVLFAVLIFAFTKATRLDSNIYISEICPVNNTVIEDGNGHFYDYIELYNPTDKPIELLGYSLSDSKNALYKYKLPNDIIPSREYKLIWIDEGISGFSLRGGEKVFLSDENGTVIDRVGLPLMDADTVYTRVDASSGWRVTAAQGKEKRTILNASGNVRADISEPIVSVKSGFYDDPFDLEMTSADGYTVYYTLDGTQPSSKSTPYTEPIHIYDRSNDDNVYSAYEYTSTTSRYVPPFPVSKATVLRAVCAKEDGHISPEICCTYFIGYKNKKGYNKLPTVSVITDPDNLFSPWKGIYSVGQFWGNLRTIDQYTSRNAPLNYRQTGSEWKRPALIEYFGRDGSVSSKDNVLLSMHGNWSLASPQKSFNLTGQQPLFSNIFGYDETKLMLRTGGTENTTSKIRDVLNQHLVENRAVRTQHAIQCQMFIDGEYWGVYNLQERLSAEFIANYYGVDKNNLVLLNNRRIAVGNEEDIGYYDELLQYAASHDLSDKESYEHISQMMDIQSFIDYIVTEEYIANSDSMQNNYSLWRTRYKQADEYSDCKWRWVIVDTDISAGMGQYNTPDMNSFLLATPYNGKLFEEPLFKELIKNPEFKKRFIVSFMDMANFNFEYSHVENEINKIVDNIEEAVVESHRRFVSKDYSLKEYQSEINVIRNFYAKRYGYITGYLKNVFELKGEKHKLQMDLTDIHKNSIAVNTSVLNSDTGNINAEYYSDYPVELKAIPAAGHEFVGWNVDGEVYNDVAISIVLDHDTVIRPVFREVKSG